MKTQDIVKLAAKAMGISEKNLKYCINEYPDGYFINSIGKDTPPSTGLLAIFPQVGEELPFYLKNK